MRGAPVQSKRGTAMRGATASTASIAAPTGGLNARDGIAEMPPTDCVIMDNWVPGTTTVGLRPGYLAYVTGFSAPVESLMTYRSATANKMFAASGTAFYDATNSGVVGAAVQSGLTNARWQHVNFGTAGGQFLVCANGTDAMRVYDGTNWASYSGGVVPGISTITSVGTTATLTTASAHGLSTGQRVTIAGTTPAAYSVASAIITVTGATTFTYTTASAPGGNATVVGTLTFAFPLLTGIASTSIKDVQVYARRLWFVEKNSFRVWYLPVDSIGGAATSIDFSPLFILGGSLQGMVTWTTSSEYATIYYAVFVSSEGEALIYTGTNPDSASSFQLSGQFRIGKPIGQRFWTKVGPETLLITQDGLMPLSKAVLIDRAAKSDSISYKITNLVADDTSLYPNVFGWQVQLYPVGNKIILNSPRATTTTNVQYVMNTITNAWCRYTNLPAICWTTLVDNIFFGGPTAVYQAEIGSTDNGAAIAGDIMPSYSYFGSAGAQKLFTAMRPIIVSNGLFQPLVRLETDYNLQEPTSSPTLSFISDTSLWDTAIWDANLWIDAQQTSRRWQTVGGIGFAATIRMTSLSKNLTAELQSIDYVFEQGTGQY